MRMPIGKMNKMYCSFTLSRYWQQSLNLGPPPCKAMALTTDLSQVFTKRGEHNIYIYEIS